MSASPVAAAAPAPRARVALITGVTGQDGSYLTELLLSKGYVVHGIKRRASSHNQLRLDEVLAEHPSAHNLTLHYGDLSDAGALAHLLRDIQPDEVYNLAAQSHVAVSFKMPKYTADVDAIGTLNLLEAIRLAGLEKRTRFYQASTSEMFGKVQAVPQSETTPFYPRSPYACAKLMAHWNTINYRESYGMFAVSGILFNHESPRRGECFVTRKITRAVAAIAAGAQSCVVLGNLDAQRDWGHARDYVTAMWAMLQAETPDDYVVATGETRSVRAFCEAAFAAAGLGPISWRGTGVDEEGVCDRTGAVLIRVSERYYRPAEVELLIGDPSKAVKALGFNPRATSFQELVEEMVQADMAALAASSGGASGAPRRRTSSVGCGGEDACGLSVPPSLAMCAIAEAPAEEFGPYVCGGVAAADDDAAPATCGGTVAAAAVVAKELGARLHALEASLEALKA